MKCPTCGKEMHKEWDTWDEKYLYSCSYCWFKHMCEKPIPQMPRGFCGDYEGAILAAQESEYDL